MGFPGVTGAAPHLPPRALLLLSGLSLLLCAGESWARIVWVPSGPLFRVEDNVVSFLCNVSEYEGPPEQNFEWTFSPRDGPKVPILSTFDPSFTDASYAERVRTGDVSLQRVSNSEVLLHILQLRSGDEGTYTCSTPSTDATVRGIYEDEVQLRVLPDTIKLSAGKQGRHSNTLTVTQGGSFELTCLAAAMDVSEHTHLSLTWQRRSAEGTSPVLTITYLGHLQPGEEYLARYSRGDVRVMYMGDHKYVLTVGAAQVWDAGAYSCLASTWVLAPDGWDKIQEKNVTLAHVNVQPIGLTVKVPVSEVRVGQGLPFNLSCLVHQDSVGPVLTRVRWLFSPSSSQETHELLGVPEPGGLDAGIHSLVVPQAWDNGTYTCRAALWAPQSNGTWYPVAEAVSDPIIVLVVPSVPVLAVSINASVLPLFSEEPTELLCHVGGSDVGSLSVSWYYAPPALSSSAHLVASLDRDWTLHVGDGYEERMERGELIFSRKDSQTFVLRIQWTTEADRGDYHCVSTAWKLRPGDSWVAIGEAASSPINIFWKEEEPALAVSAQLVKLVSAAGGTFEMICSISAKNLRSPRYSVQVTAEKQMSLSSGPTQVILLSRDGQIRRESDGNTMLEKIKEGVYRFRIYQARVQDAGAYRCSVTAWTQGGGGSWREAGGQTSEAVLLDFQSSGPVFNVTAYADSTSVYLGDRAEFWCIITIDGPAMDPEDVTFQVSWFSQRPGGTAILLVSVDRMAQVWHSRRNGTSEVALERISNMEFRLRIYNCEEGDTRGYYCTVTPWVRSGEGGWDQRASVTSNVVPVSIRMDLLSAFKYPLLIGVGVSLLAGCLACLIGYCSSRLCCKSPPKQDTRREHRRLMSMEMD